MNTSSENPFANPQSRSVCDHIVSTILQSHVLDPTKVSPDISFVDLGLSLQQDSPVIQRIDHILFEGARSILSVFGDQTPKTVHDLQDRFWLAVQLLWTSLSSLSPKPLDPHGFEEFLSAVDNEQRTIAQALVQRN